MFNKIHLFLNQNYQTLKHWLLIGLGVLLLVFSMIVIAGQNRLIAQVKDLSEQNKQLAKDNKELNTKTVRIGEENQSIAKQGRSFTLCIGQVFAKYTRDGIPVNNLNLDTCTTDSQTSNTNDTPTGGTAPNTSGGTSGGTQGAAPSSSSSIPASSPNNTTAQPTPQPNNSQPDNEGIIIDLPLLPKISIGSPF